MDIKKIVFSDGTELNNISPELNNLISSYFAISPKTISHKRSHHKKTYRGGWSAKAWEREQELELVRLRDMEGKSWKFVARVLGRTVNGVAQRYSKVLHNGKRDIILRELVNTKPTPQEEARKIPVHYSQ